jgi:hypothetical protein
MKTTPTPGPWFLRTGDSHIVVCGSDGDSIAGLARTTPDRIDPSEQEANARLIAAAPDMLNQLRAVERWMSGYGTTTQSAMREKVRATIAKAEGR